MSTFAPVTGTKPGSSKHKQMLASCQSSYAGKVRPPAFDHFLEGTPSVSDKLLAMFAARNGSLEDNPEPTSWEQRHVEIERAFECLLTLADNHGRCVILNNRCVTKERVGHFVRLRHILDLYMMKAQGISCWRTKTITIRKSNNTYEQLMVLAHEISHQMFNHGEVASVSALEQEAQADLTGYLLLHALGVSWWSSRTVHYLTSKMPADEAVRAWALIEEYALRLVYEVKQIAAEYDKKSQA